MNQPSSEPGFKLPDDWHIQSAEEHRQLIEKRNLVVPAPRVFCLKSDSEPEGASSHFAERSPGQVFNAASSSIQFLRAIGFAPQEEDVAHA